MILILRPCPHAKRPTVETELPDLKKDLTDKEEPIWKKSVSETAIGLRPTVSRFLSETDEPRIKWSKIEARLAIRPTLRIETDDAKCVNRIAETTDPHLDLERRDKDDPRDRYSHTDSR
jgi:hypothetical protein